jgi:hypothetical protein
MHTLFDNAIQSIQLGVEDIFDWSALMTPQTNLMPGLLSDRAT